MTLKHVAIVGFSDLTIDRVADLSDDTEIWSLNFAWLYPALTRIDRLFEIHPEWYLETPDQASIKHKKWLRKEQGIPVIYTNPTAPEGSMDWVVNGRPYPLLDVLTKTGVANSLRGAEWQPMFGSTMDYMMALAVAELEAGDTIELIGIEMDTSSEYEYQKASLGYWMGAANQKGIIVKQQDVSRLIRPLPYHEGGQMIGRQTVEAHVQHMQTAQSQMLGAYNQQLGVFTYMREALAEKMEAEKRDATEDEAQAIYDQGKRAEEAKTGLDASSGALSSLQNVLREFDTADNPTYVKPKLSSKAEVQVGAK